jgi:hypothetical protein
MLVGEKFGGCGGGRHSGVGCDDGHVELVSKLDVESVNESQVVSAFPRADYEC